ncbi:AAA family ATPase [Kutzneria buriramensis]|uniref:AAA domain-containing protein n=1 Tax=Kutzneria buriramensis TaxID=1045776 RepID=A0A3E0GYU3_9PSEU|nr:AAA family ATPase [Kutzneria buriramensis]REH34931.1 AAA domain-containing protein [Kutzneria buriramensis]
MTEGLIIELGDRDMMVVAGLPGAGKSTMLGHAAGALAVLDSDEVRGRLRTALPAATPYRYYRPIVHVWHRFRVAAAAAFGRGPVVVHEPSTRATTRAWLAVLGAVTRRPVRMLWLDVTAEEAIAGQRGRGRVLRARSFERHARRAARMREALLAERVPPGWRSAQILTRSAADTAALVGSPGGRERLRPT